MARPLPIPGRAEALKCQEAADRAFVEAVETILAWGVTRKELALSCGVCTQLVSLWLRGLRRPNRQIYYELITWAEKIRNGDGGSLSELRRLASQLYPD